VKDEPAPLPAGSAQTVSRGIRILVVESHALVGAALGRLLAGSPLAAAVETVPDCDSATARLGASDFDLVLCELSGSPRNAMALVSTLVSLGRDVPVVLLSSAEDEQLLLDALTSGATGFFTKDCAPEDFLDGLSSVLRGHYTVGKKLKPRVMARLANAKKAASSR
jgi:two-component system invasion response regulator UvrY